MTKHQKAIFILSVFLLGACGKKRSGSALTTRAIEPPITTNTPSGFTTLFDLQSFAADANLSTIRDRFFSASGGTVYIKSVMAALDSRMTTLAAQAATSTRSCISEATQEFTVTSPIDLSFTHHLNCIETIDDSHWVAFGNANSVFYLREQMTDGSMTLASVDSSDNVELWFIVANQGGTGSQSMMHLKSTASTGVLEFAVTGTNIGVGCGVQLMSNANYIYVSGKIDDSSGGAGADCSTVSSSSVCASASSLEAASTSQCTDAGLDSFTLSALTTSTLSYTEFYKFGQLTKPSLTEF